MRRRTWLSFFGAVLLACAVPVVSGGQTSTPAKTPVKKKKTTSSKSKRIAKPASQMAPTPDRIREIQSALQRKGTYQGEPTGKWDDATVEAMKNYQDKNGITPTGKIDALSLQKLGLGSETAGKGAPLPVAAHPADPPAPNPASTLAPSPPPAK